MKILQRNPYQQIKLYKRKLIYEVTNIHEIQITAVFNHAFKQWRFSFIIISKEKMPTSSSKNKMNNTTGNLLKSGYPKKKWNLIQKPLTYLNTEVRIGEGDTTFFHENIPSQT